MIEVRITLKTNFINCLNVDDYIYKNWSQGILYKIIYRHESILWWLNMRHTHNVIVKRTNTRSILRQSILPDIYSSLGQNVLTQKGKVIKSKTLIIILLCLLTLRKFKFMMNPFSFTFNRQTSRKNITTFFLFWFLLFSLQFTKITFTLVFHLLL